MRGRRRLLPLALVAAAAAVVAVFLLRDDGDEGIRLSHAQLVARIDAICADLALANERLEPPFRPYSTESEPFFASFHDNVEQAAAELDDLEPDEADAAAFGRLAEGYDDLRLALEAAQAAAATDQLQEIVTLISELERVAEGVEAAEADLGVCPGEASVRKSVVASVKRTRENPLEETGELGG